MFSPEELKRMPRKTLSLATELQGRLRFVPPEIRGIYGDALRPYMVGKKGKDALQPPKSFAELRRMHDEGMRAIMNNLKMRKIPREMRSAIARIKRVMAARGYSPGLISEAEAAIMRYRRRLAEGTSHLPRLGKKEFPASDAALLYARFALNHLQSWLFLERLEHRIGRHG